MVELIGGGGAEIGTTEIACTLCSCSVEYQFVVGKERSTVDLRACKPLGSSS